jgi:hypothetical protein
VIVLDYDDALFIQLLQKRARFNTITDADVEDCFWQVAADFKAAVLAQGKDWEKVRHHYKRVVHAGLVALLRDTTGLRIIP